MDLYINSLRSKALNLYHRLEGRLPDNVCLDKLPECSCFFVRFMNCSHPVKGMSINIAGSYGLCELALWDGTPGGGVTYEEDFGYWDVNAVDGLDELLNEIERVYNLCTKASSDLTEE